MAQPLVSIVIPTYNEAEDIACTLDACVAIKYPNKEIIVVDDSEDATPEVVAGYAKAGVQLVRRERNHGGRCGARNEGIERSRGEIVVILNADVCPNPDFLDRVLPHYEHDKDFVLVESEVANVERLFARYNEAMHRRLNDGTNWVDWTEGFSCRREAALRVGMFPTPPITIMAGEDHYFSRKLAKAGYRRVLDRSICVPHVAPARLGDYWAAQKIRTFPPTSYFLEGKPLWYLTLKAPAKTLRNLLRVLLVVPEAIEAWKLSQCSPRGRADWLPFWWAGAIREAAIAFGEWQGLLRLWRWYLREGPIPVQVW